VGRTATARVRVKGAGQPFAWSFRNHVTPVLTKMGCNQGACHGALAGKNGFKLTLRGYDPDVDYDTLTRQAVGRRISLAEPSASLLLKKATFELPHAGGKRFSADSLEYRVIAEWIANGTPAPKDNDVGRDCPRSFPAAHGVEAGVEQQLVVRARYTDGRAEDVTRWVKFTSASEGVATVDDSGRLKTTGHGESAITLWYQNKVLYARVAVPYPNEVSPADYSKFQPANFIDEQMLDKWKSLKLVPSPRSTDAQFLRRVYLDAAGSCLRRRRWKSFSAMRRPTSAPKPSPSFSIVMSLPITGPISGPTYCWFPHVSFAPMPCGRSTTGSATA
jgi:hypothetical protein